MPTNVTVDDLERILGRWNKGDVPNAAKNQIFQLSAKPVEKIFEMISLAGPVGSKTGEELGEAVGEAVTRPFALCYFIGYELASGKMSRADGTPYLMAATEPIQDFVMRLVGNLLGRELASPELVRQKALEISRLVAEASNDICILGVENFRKLYE